ncbi:hypothetical protein [Tepidiphilus succinatimandens]|jgi:hypothetical protein|uniref:hypothetical protein n=1 Tax=Tepidiphilus succinatimandens TaxID=224436 RepID=UPI00112F49BE|nr:hypothetical protein [Tepidiphilus succinatimandens]
MNQNTKLDEISATSESRGCAKHCSPAAVQTHAPVIDDTPARVKLLVASVTQQSAECLLGSQPL